MTCIYALPPRAAHALVSVYICLWWFCSHTPLPLLSGCIWYCWEIPLASVFVPTHFVFFIFIILYTSCYTCPPLKYPPHSYPLGFFCKYSWWHSSAPNNCPLRIISVAIACPGYHCCTLFFTSPATFPSASEQTNTALLFCVPRSVPYMGYMHPEEKPHQLLVV